MRQHLNTLFVTLDGSYLLKEGEAVVIRFAPVEGVSPMIHDFL
jgi:hypothetical protein